MSGEASLLAASQAFAESPLLATKLKNKTLGTQATVQRHERMLVIWDKLQLTAYSINTLREKAITKEYFARKNRSQLFLLISSDFSESYLSKRKSFSNVFIFKKP